MRRGPARAKGFTLLEVLVALAILSGVLVLGYQVVAGAIAAEERSVRWTKATLLGEAFLREAVPPYPEPGETADRFPGLDNAYSWKLSVRESPYPDARVVELTVTYSNDGDAESVTVAEIAVK